jgi:heme exporter protein A
VGQSQASTAGLGIEYQEIEKRYGARFALRGISLRIEPGEAIGLVGANGSGKTTLLKLTAGLMRPSSGKINFSRDQSGQISFVSHNTLLYDELTADENLALFADLYALNNLHERCAEALDSAGLGGRGQDLVRGFSRGMRQRLTIARALLPNPGLLLLDEPATGLDAAGQQWLGETLARLREKSCTIVMSTHGRSETHSILSRAIRLDSGKVIADSSASGDKQAVLATALLEEAG